MVKTVFIGGGNMATALIGGMARSGGVAGVLVVEPDAGQRSVLERDHGVATLGAADASLADASLVVWAVKPQAFSAASMAAGPHVSGALQLSVMAGVRSEAIVRATGSERVVRAMPNTPALIGEGIAALFARAGATASDRVRCEALLAPTGATMWLDDEGALDAVTALSASGPAYVFYLLEAMIDAGTAMGLTLDQSRRLAVQTVRGSAALVAGSQDGPAQLRERVTSKGGTTQAAVAVLDGRGVKAAFVAAIVAARNRAAVLGDELERPIT
ncbi:MAG: pyrroline-5-carboxylate reductase [Caldimonas sp.]